jgi:hypothetical protein
MTYSFVRRQRKKPRWGAQGFFGFLIRQTVMTGKPSPKANLISSNYLWLTPRGDGESQLRALGKSRLQKRMTSK